MKQSIRLILLLVSITIANNLSAQNLNDDVWFFAKSYKDSVALRWHFNNAKLWQEFINKGASLYRKDVSTGESVLLNEYPMTPFDDSLWVYYEYGYKDTVLSRKREIDKNTLIALSMQRPDLFPFTHNRKDEGNATSEGLFDDTLVSRHFFHTMACFESKEAGFVAAMYYVDDAVTKGKKYEYYLCLGKDAVSKSIAKVEVNTASMYPAVSPKIVYDYTNKKMATIKWKKIDTSFTYVPFYDIYRSEDRDKGYVKINKEPQLSIFKNEGADSSYAFYSDSTLEKDKVYYYKVVGRDILWEYTAYSEPYMVRQVTRLEELPMIVKNETIGRKVNKLTWQYNEIDKEQITGFRIYRSEYFDSLYTPLSKDLPVTALTYTDEQPVLDGYYKVMMRGEAGDTLWSFPSYAHIPDSIAPAPPIIHSAVCDSNGVIKIIWSHHGEKDLFQYRVLKANHMTDEFSGVYTSEKLDTIAYDTVSLYTTTEHVYYMMQLLDKTYNPSGYSNIVKVKRIDTIPPTAPVIHDFTTDTSGITLRWARSSSEDAVKTVLQRRMKDEMSWHEYKTFINDSATYKIFRDSSVLKGEWYEYRLQTYDDDGLASGFTEPFAIRAYDNGIRPPLTVYKAEVNKKKHSVKITWTYSELKVEYFQIYRGTNDKPITILKSCEENIREYYDTEIGPGNKYTYRLKVVFKDGGESPYTQEIIVEL